MDIDSVLEKFFNNPKISFYLGLLKTDKWCTLKENEKKKFFLRFNSAFCEFLDIDEVNIEIDNLNTDNYKDGISFENLIVKDKSHYVINNINNNQYLILYEYIFRVREEIQNLVCFTRYGDNFDSRLRALWNKNLDRSSFANIKIDFYIEDGEYLSEYQDVKLDAKEYAEKLLIEIVKRNFKNSKNTYDEQYFMANKDILVNNSIIDIGVSLLDKEMNQENVYKNVIMNIKNKIESLGTNDLSTVSDDVLVYAICPSVSKVLDIKVLVKVYKEILNRVYGELEIKYKKAKVIINGNEWPVKYFLNNHLNIVLYECLRDVDNLVRKDEDFLNSEKVLKLGIEEAIISLKKNWLYKIVLKLDSMSDLDGIVALGEQPLYRLVDKDNLYNNLKNSSNGVIPLKKRGK